LQDRLYVNQGGGKFARDSRALPDMPTSTAAVAAGDFTGDGRLDLFVGGRLAPRNYPAPTRSYLLRNDGGHFTDSRKPSPRTWFTLGERSPPRCGSTLTATGDWIS